MPPPPAVDPKEKEEEHEEAKPESEVDGLQEEDMVDARAADLQAEQQAIFDSLMSELTQEAKRRRLQEAGAEANGLQETEADGLPRQT